MSKILRRASIAVATLLVVAAASGVPASARPFATAGIPTPPRAGERHSPLWTYVTSVYVPNTADCVAQFNFPCYQPFQLQKAYDLNPLINQNLNGAVTATVFVASASRATREPTSPPS